MGPAGPADAAVIGRVIAVYVWGGEDSDEGAGCPVVPRCPAAYLRPWVDGELTASPAEEWSQHRQGHQETGS
jgi:hypothetical protein